MIAQATRRPAERYDNIMSIYVYNIMPARVCLEKETVRTLTLTRTYTHTPVRIDSDTQSRESVYLWVHVRERACASVYLRVRVCVYIAGEVGSSVDGESKMARLTRSRDRRRPRHDDGTTP